MGRLTDTAPRPANSRAQSTRTPRVWAWATAAVTVCGSARSPRSTGTNTAPDWSALSCAMAESTPSGPSSTNVVTPWPSSVRTPSAKRTASRTWRTQYSGSHSSAAVASSPVRFDTTGMRGDSYDRPSATCRKSASIGSIRWEWKAWETVSRLVLRPSKAAATARTASSSPEITVAEGPLTAAIDTPSTRAAITSASVACTATIAPPSGNACINRPRAATSAQASSSDHTPATCAAANSPIE
ncbi:hypothetical protein JCM4814A_06590 [Streptomyces phaeofaciens JCM 4814]